ncbi:MAG: glycine betaine ABC transporter substrate-binding protein [Rhodospirillaceae bacterium]
MRNLKKLYLTITAFLILIAGPAQGFEGKSISIGSKAFTESVILGEIASFLLKADGVPNVHRRQMGGTRILWNALRRGDIDVYPEYTGTIRQEIYAGKKSLTDPLSLKQALARDGIGMSSPLGFANNYALGMTAARAKELNVSRISQLSKIQNLQLGFSNEFLDRSDGWSSLKRVYNFKTRDARGLDHDLAYRALSQGLLDVTDLYTTDAEISYYKLRTLEDDLNHFPSYEAVYLYRLQRASQFPLLKSLTRIAGKVSAIQMAGLNKMVKIEKKSESDVASHFLKEKIFLQTETNSQNLYQRIIRSTGEHLWLVMLSMLAAIILAVPLGVYSFWHETPGQLVLGISGIVQTIPGLAMLVFMIPIFGIGAFPTIAALFLYSLLPIVRNTYTGLKGVDKSLTEAAKMFGLSRLSCLIHIQLPLALPIIITGIKTSAVINIGTATLGAIIGAGGYGQPILTGIRLDNISLILEGAIPAAAMAIATQYLFELLEKRRSKLGKIKK